MEEEFVVGKFEPIKLVLFLFWLLMELLHVKLLIEFLELSRACLLLIELFHVLCRFGKDLNAY